MSRQRDLGAEGSGGQLEPESFQGVFKELMKCSIRAYPRRQTDRQEDPEEVCSCLVLETQLRGTVELLPVPSQPGPLDATG